MTNEQLNAADRPADIDGEGLAMRPFSESLPMALLLAREAAMRLFRPLLTEHGLTEQQWRVLRALAASAEPLEAGVLAEHTSLLSPSLSRILSNLEQRHLIDRETVAHDQRRSITSLSPKGRHLVQRVAPHSEAIYSGIEQWFGANRLRELLAELEQLSLLDADDSSRPAGVRPVPQNGTRTCREAS